MRRSIWTSLATMFLGLVLAGLQVAP